MNKFMNLIILFISILTLTFSSVQHFNSSSGHLDFSIYKTLCEHYHGGEAYAVLYRENGS